MNSCSQIGHKRTKETFDKQIGSGGEGGRGLYQQMLRVKCERCGEVLLERQAKNWDFA